MKTFREKLRRNNGFTMSEILLAVAIIAILGAVGVVAATTMVKNTRQKSLDKMAETIFIAAERNIQAAVISGRADELGEDDGLVVLRKGETNEKLVLPEGAVDSVISNGEWLLRYNIEGESIHVIETYFTTADNKYAETFRGADAETLKGEHDSHTGNVGYYGADDLDYTNYKLPDTEEKDALKPNASVLVLNKEELGVLVRIGLPDPAKANQFYSINNDGTANPMDPKNVHFTVRIKGVTSNKSIEFTGQLKKDSVYRHYTWNGYTDTKLSYVNEAEYAYYTYIPLDNLKSGKFADLVSGTVTPVSINNVTAITFNGKEELPGEEDRIKPGEDILIEATAVCAGEDSVQVVKTDDSMQYQPYWQVNSLFDKRVTDGGDAFVYVSYGRHLQNLNVLTSKMQADTNIKVEQSRTIDFGVADGDENKIFIDYWNNLYAGITFSPIQNEKIIEFNGNAEITSNGNVVSGKDADNNEKVTGIKNITIQVPADTTGYEGVGLFGMYYGSAIKNLVLDNVMISGGSESNDFNTGAIAGKTGDGEVKLENCLVKHSFIRNHSNNETDSAGGLIGSAPSVNMSSCYAINTFVYASKGSAGGLIGSGAGTIGGPIDERKGCAVRNEKTAIYSFINAGGVSAFNFDTFRANNTTGVVGGLDNTNVIGVSAAGNAGGLVGVASGAVTINGSYAATVVSAKKTAGGLVGATEGSATVESSYADCYLMGRQCAGLVGLCSICSLKDSYSAGFVIRIADEGDGDPLAAGLCGSDSGTITNCYSLLNFDDIFDDSIFAEPDALTFNEGYVQNYPDDAEPQMPADAKIYGLCLGGTVTDSFFTYGGETEAQSNLGEYKSIRDIIQDESAPMVKKSGSVEEAIGEGDPLTIVNKNAFELATALADKLIGDEDEKAIIPEFIEELPHNGDWLERPGNKLWARIYKTSGNKYVMFFETGVKKNKLPGDEAVTLTVVGEWVADDMKEGEATEDSGFLRQADVLPDDTDQTAATKLAKAKLIAPWQYNETGWKSDYVANYKTILQTITTVTFDEDFCMDKKVDPAVSVAKPLSMRAWFKNFRKVTKINNINDLDVSEVTSMEETFRNCYEMLEYDLSKWDTAKVTSMRYMFGNNLYEDGATSGVTSNQSLHGKATSFTFGEKFVTSEVVSMERMFQRQDGLNSTNDTEFNEAIHDFDVSKVKDMSFIFSDCHNISKLDLSNWDTSSVENMDAIFYRSVKLAEIDVTGKFSTESATTMWAMFDMWPANNVLKELDVRSFDTSKVVNMAYIFSNNKKLETIYASSKFTIDALATGSPLKKDDYGSYYTTTDSLMFKDCDVLVGGCGTEWKSKTGDAKTNKTYAWIDGRYINKITKNGEGYFTNEDYPEVFARIYDNDEGKYTMYFEYGSWADNGHSTAPLNEWRGSGQNGFILSNVVPWNSYNKKSSVSKVVFTEHFYQIVKPVSLANWFNGFSEVTEFVSIEKLNTSKVTSLANTFKGCAALPDINIREWDTSNVVTMANMFNGCASFLDLDVSGLDTSNVLMMNYLFAGCKNMREVDIGGWTGGIDTNVAYMFTGDQNLQTIYATESFNVPRVANNSNYYTFNGCKVLSGGYGTKPTSSGHASEGWNHYAHIDKASDPGCFTDKVDKPCIGSALILKTGIEDEFELHLYAFNSDAYQSDREAAGNNIEKDIPKFYFGGGGRAWDSHRETITTVKFHDKGTLKPNTFFAWFQNFTKLTDFDAEKQMDTSVATRLDNMFQGCSALEELDASYWNTSKVTKMSYTFAGCTAFVDVDLSGLDTSNVLNMTYTFYGCSNMREVDIGGWTGGIDTNIAYMFAGDKNLQTIYATESFNVPRVANNSNYYTFNGCKVLSGGYGTKPTSSGHASEGWNHYAHIDKASDPGCFTDRADKLSIGSALILKTTVDDEFVLHLYSIGSAAYQSDKQNAGDSLEKDIPKFYFGGGGRVWDDYRAKITTVKFHDKGTLKPNTFFAWFQNFTKLTDFDAEKQMDTSAATRLDNMFQGCTALEGIDVSYWNTSNVTGMSYTFAGCTAFVDVDLNGLDTSKVLNMTYAFNGCSNMREVDIGGWTAGIDTNIAYMFAGDKNLQTIYATESFNVPRVANNSNYYTFDGCKVLSGGYGTKPTSSGHASEGWNHYAHIDKASDPGCFTDRADKSNIGSALILKTTVDDEFVLHIYAIDSATYQSDKQNAGNNLEKDISKFNFGGGGRVWDDYRAKITTVKFHDKGTLKPNTFFAWFQNFTKLTDFDAEKQMDTSAATRLDNMFQGCTALEGIDVSYWNTSNVTGMSYTFAGCTAFVSVDLSGLDTSNVLNMTYTFNGCSNMQEVDIGGWTAGIDTNIAYMFAGDRKLRTIYATESFNVPRVANNSNYYTFNGCSVLVGGNGTRPTSSGHASEGWNHYAHIDKAGDPGCFTDKATKPAGDCSFILVQEDTKHILHIYRCGSSDYVDDLAAFGTSVEANNVSCVIGSTGTDWNSYRGIITDVVFHDSTTLKPTSFAGWFANCTVLTTFDTAGAINTSAATSMESMFEGCTSLVTLDLKKWNTSNVTNMNNMFKGCSALTTITVETFDTGAVTSGADMFDGCTSLIGGRGTAYANESVADVSFACIDYGTIRPGYLTGTITISEDAEHGGLMIITLTKTDSSQVTIYYYNGTFYAVKDDAVAQYLLDHPDP